MGAKREYSYNAKRHKTRLFLDFYVNACSITKGAFEKNQITVTDFDRLITKVTNCLEKLYKLCCNHHDESLSLIQRLCLFEQCARLLWTSSLSSKAENKLIDQLRDLFYKSSGEKLDEDEQIFIDEMVLIRRLYCKDNDACYQFFGKKPENPGVFLSLICSFMPPHISNEIEVPIRNILHRACRKREEQARKATTERPTTEAESVIPVIEQTFLKPPPRKPRRPLAPVETHQNGHTTTLMK